jgi:hypothetical protein
MIIRHPYACLVVTHWNRPAAPAYAEPSEQNDSEDTVTEVRYSRQEALQRMKRAVADLQDGLRGVDTWVLASRLLGLRVMLDE